MASVKELIKAGEARLASQASGRLEAEILLALALSKPRAFLFAHPEQAVDNATASRFLELVERRRAGEPVAYITGEREFWSVPIRVSPDVLIPRPETEVLVEAALARVPPGSAARIADLGTGSGAIALALALERPICDVHASDISPEALAVARDNAARLGISNIRFHQGSWLAGLSGRFDLVVSNPPYIRAGDPHLEAGDLRFEPHAALLAGPDGLDAIREIVRQAPDRLKPGGWLIFEHGHDQAHDSQALLKTHGFQEIETLRDLAGTKRVTLGRQQQPPAG